jgi:hypothetical protein
MVSGGHLAYPKHVFDQIYETDLVFVSDCWKLCGDAHCCNFSRYKSNFKLLARTHFQELPLLPGEFEYMKDHGRLDQFGDYELKTVEFDIGDYVFRAESIISRKQGCACDHNIRPTICRLYPLLPCYEPNGRLIGTERVGIYEEIEQLAGMSPACQLSAIPFDQLQSFLSIANVIAASPLQLFYIMAYRLTKNHVARQLGRRFEDSERDIFSVFEAGLFRNKLVRPARLRRQLQTLFRTFQAEYGEDFHQA